MATIMFYDVIVFLLFIGNLRETECVTLHISRNTEEKYSGCISGLVDGQDRYIYSSTIDTTTFDLSKRRNIVFQLKRSASDIFDPICSLNMLSAVCSNSPRNGCYCKSNTSSTLDIIMNNTANVLYSNSLARLFLPDPVLGNDDYSNNETVSVVQSDFTENLTVDGNFLNPASCILSKPPPSFTLKWCVTGLSSHNLSIFSGQKIFSEGENCVDFTFNSSSSLDSFSVSFIEKINCQRNRTYHCFFNELTSTIPTTMNTTNATITIGSSSNANTYKDNSAAIIGGVIGGVAFIVVAGVIVFFVIRHKKRTRNINSKPNTDEPLKDPEAHPTTRAENDKASSMAPKTTKDIPSHSIVIYPEIVSKTEANVASSNGEERSKRRKKKSRRGKKSEKENTEKDATRSTSNVEVHFKESEDSSGKIKQSNLEVISFKKRPPSVEITNNPNPITPRPLPQIRASSEPKSSK